MSYETNQSKNELVNTLISVAAPLVQLIVITLVALSDQLNLTKVFLNKDLLPIVNLASIFMIASGIIYTNTKSSTAVSRAYSQIPTKLFFIQALLAILLLVSITNHQLFENYSVVTQYFSYSSFIIVSGFILYNGFQIHFAKIEVRNEANYYPKIAKLLSQQGMLETKKFRLVSTIDDPLDKYKNKYVKIEIADKEYILLTDYHVRNIHSFWNTSEVPEYVKSYFSSSSAEESK